MAKLKDLYIAKSMKDLNEKCLFEFDRGRSIKSYLTMVNKTYQAAETAFSGKDEERAYILYMRYVDAMMKIRKTKEYQAQSNHYNTLFGNAKLQTAVGKAETLSETLKKRYDKLEKSKSVPKAPTKNVSDVDSKEKESNTSTEYKFPSNSVTSLELHKLLYKDQKKLILMDIRSIEDYQDSHFVHSASINIPKNAITPGSVTSKIQAGIPLDHIKLWNTRDSVDLVVILDWHSTFKRLQDKSDPLRSLKDSIFKWEQVKQLLREPVILEGGYADWLETFPQFTSNPQANPPDNKPKTSNVNSLLDFNYSDLRISFNSTNDDKSITTKPDHLDVPVVNGVTSQDELITPEKDKADSDTKNGMPATFDSKSLNQVDSISSLYPKIDVNESIIKHPDKLPNIIPNGKHNDILSVPRFDRSIKPKLSESSNSAVLSNSDKSQDRTLQNTPLIVDRSTKPQLPADSGHIENQHKKQSKCNLPDMNKKVDVEMEQFKLKVNKEKEEKECFAELEEKENLQVSVQDQMKNETYKKDFKMSSDKSDEIAQLEKNIFKMQKENDNQEKRVLELQEKKLLHLLSVQESMKLDAEKLAEKEVKAKTELAAAMRHSKPTKGDDVSLSGSTSNAISSSKIDPNANTSDTSLPAKDEKQVVKGPRPTPTSTKQNENTNTGVKSNLIKETLPNIHKTNTNSTAKPAVVESQEKAPNQVAKSLTSIKPSFHDASPIVSPSHNNSKKSSLNSPSKTNLSNTSSNSKSNGSNSLVYQAALNDEPSSQSVGLKRSFSSPNIAKMVQKHADGQQIPAMPSRQNKPSVIEQIKPSPNRIAKPITQEESDPFVSSLNLSLRGVYGGEGRAKCGLRNLGNSCYMNSVLQCMFNTTHLAEYILNNSYKHDINRKNILGYSGRVAESFAVLMRAIWSGQYRYLIPSDMKQIAGGINSNFSSYTQEDSHEFLLFLLDGLHEDLNRITNFKYEEEPDNSRLNDEQAAQEAWKYHKKRNESIVIELFTGQYRATLICLHCKKSSRKFDAFRFLTLSLPSCSASLTDLIRDFSKQEKLTGDDRWNCPNCKVPREALRTIAIWKLPPILIIHLKRFVYSGRWRDKIHSHVSFPTSGLDLTNYTCGTVKRGKYDLYAVSHHHGAGLDSGHYTASCRSVNDNRWYKFDDTEVSVTSSPQNSSAFILFYSNYPRKQPQMSF